MQSFSGVTSLMEVVEAMKASCGIFVVKALSHSSEGGVFKSQQLGKPLQCSCVLGQANGLSCALSFTALRFYSTLL